MKTTARIPISIFAILTACGSIRAQPTPAPTSGDIPCSSDISAAAQRDTLAAQPDSDGFISLFDGRTFKGWWQNCMTSHSASDRVRGAVFRVDTARRAIYSASRNGNTTGGILLTHKRYKHYEILFDHWGAWNNDGGFFNRCTPAGGAWQTLLDYMPGKSVGGSYGEAYVIDFAIIPFDLGNNDSTAIIPGHNYTAGNGTVWPGQNWTTKTAALAARGEATGCAPSGCVAADWRKNWKPASSSDGWNTIRIQFYGGLGQNQSMAGDKVHMHSFFRSKLDGVQTRLNDMKWISMAFDSLALTNGQVAGAPMNPVGFEVHGGGRFPNQAGTWYRNIKIRELDSLGKPLRPVTTGLTPTGAGPSRLRYTAEGLAGELDLDHRISISDAQGRVLAEFSGRPGPVHYRLPETVRGILWVSLFTSRGIERIRMARVEE